jgi:hypothetical protein
MTGSRRTEEVWSWCLTNSTAVVLASSRVVEFGAAGSRAQLQLAAREQQVRSIAAVLLGIDKKGSCKIEIRHTLARRNGS